MICPLCFSTKEWYQSLDTSAEKNIYAPICPDCNLIYIDGIWHDQLFELIEGTYLYHWSHTRINEKANEVQKRIDKMKGFL